jgi:PKD repeat protein
MAAMSASNASDSAHAAGGRSIVLVAQPPFKNPGILTLGTLSIQQSINFSINAISSNGNKLSFSWDWGDGTPLGSGAAPSHTYLVAGSYTVTVTTTESGTSTPRIDKISVTIVDVIKSARLQTNEFWSKKNADSISLTGVVRIPANQPLAGKIVDFDIGGVLLNFKLDAKGAATLTTNSNNVVTSSGTIQSSNKCNARFKIFSRKRPKGTDFVDSKFSLSYKNGSIQDALAFPSLVTNRNANRDNVRITCKLTFDADSETRAGVLFQSGINQVYTSTQGKKGSTR